MNPNATIYDGFLNSELNAANFSREANSSMRFRNPLVTEISNITEAGVNFWMYIQNPFNTNANRGTILDCGNTLIITLNDTLLRVNVTQNITSRIGAITT